MKARAELGLMKRNVGNSLITKQSKLSKVINDLCKKIRQAEIKRVVSIA